MTIRRDETGAILGSRFTIGEDDPQGYGPWIGVPHERQAVCAVVDCRQRGRPQVCYSDGRYHHHGCVHYDTADPRVRQYVWCWLCDEHYALLKTESDARRAARSQTSAMWGDDR